MTARWLAVPAAAAGIVVVAGVAARPFLASSEPAPTRVTVMSPPVPAQALTVATRSAVAATRCQPRRRPGSDCGPLTVVNVGAYRYDDAHVVVELVGLLDSATPATPIAMRVLVRMSPSGWAAAVVTP